MSAAYGSRTLVGRVERWAREVLRELVDRVRHRPAQVAALGTLVRERRRGREAVHVRRAFEEPRSEAEVRERLRDLLHLADPAIRHGRGAGQGALHDGTLLGLAVRDLALEDLEDAQRLRRDEQLHGQRRRALRERRVAHLQGGGGADLPVEHADVEPGERETLHVGTRSVETRPAPGPRGRTDDADVDDVAADDLRDFADRRRRDRVAVDVERSRARRAHRRGDLFGERLRLRGRDDGKEDLARHEEVGERPHVLDAGGRREAARAGAPSVEARPDRDAVRPEGLADGLAHLADPEQADVHGGSIRPSPGAGGRRGGGRGATPRGPGAEPPDRCHICLTSLSDSRERMQRMLQALRSRLLAWRYEATGEGRGPRDLRVDLLRGFCVVVMIIDHVGGEQPWLYVFTGGGGGLASARPGSLPPSGRPRRVVYDTTVDVGGGRT